MGWSFIASTLPVSDDEDEENRTQARVAHTSGGGIGPKNIRRAFSSPDHAHRFAHHAIRGDEDEENDLDGAEMRPDDFRQQLLIAGDKAARLGARNRSGVPDSE